VDCRAEGCWQRAAGAPIAGRQRKHVVVQRARAPSRCSCWSCCWLRQRPGSRRRQSEWGGAWPWRVWRHLCRLPPPQWGAAAAGRARAGARLHARRACHPPSAMQSLPAELPELRAQARADQGHRRPQGAPLFQGVARLHHGNGLHADAAPPAQRAHPEHLQAGAAQGGALMVGTGVVAGAGRGVVAGAAAGGRRPCQWWPPHTAPTRCPPLCLQCEYGYTQNWLGTKCCERQGGVGAGMRPLCRGPAPGAACRAGNGARPANAQPPLLGGRPQLPYRWSRPSPPLSTPTLNRLRARVWNLGKRHVLEVSAWHRVARRQAPSDLQALPSWNAAQPGRRRLRKQERHRGVVRRCDRRGMVQAAPLRSGRCTPPARARCRAHLHTRAPLATDPQVASVAWRRTVPCVETATLPTSATPRRACAPVRRGAHAWPRSLPCALACRHLSR
jgi:hypothetical protein